MIVLIKTAGAVAVFPSKIVFEGRAEQMNVRNNIGREAEYCVTSGEKECFRLADGNTKAIIVQPMKGQINVEEYLDDEIVNAVEIFAVNMNEKAPKKSGFSTIALGFAILAAIIAVFIIVKRFK